MKRNVQIVVVFIIVLTITVLLLSIPWERKDVIKIGADYALSGNLARYGDWATKGILLALEEINRQGGIGGRLIEVIFEDNKGKPAEAVSAYQKLTGIDDVKYVITFQSSVALAIAPLANQDHVVQMDVAATTPDYSTPNDFTFRTSISATQLAKESAQYLSDILDVSEIGILIINNDFGLGMATVFKEEYPGTVVVEEIFEQDETDFRTHILKLKDANISTVFMVSHLKESGMILKQAKEINFNAQFFSDIYSIEGPEFIQAAQDAANGVLYLAPKFYPGDSNAVVSSFASRYRTAYQEDATYFAAQAYDGVIALAESLKLCDYQDIECVVGALMELDFEGASGHINFDINGDVKKPVELKIVENGEYKRIEHAENEVY